MAALLTALSYVGLALLLGSVLARRWLTPGHPGLAPSLSGLALLALSWAGQMTVTLTDLGMTGLPDVLDYVTTTATGRAMLTGLLGATLLLAVEVAAWPALLGVLAAGVTVWGVAGIGHGDGHGLWVRFLHAAHAGAMTVWVGGVLALASTRRLSPDLARRFTPAALGSVTVLSGSGVLMATEHLTALAQWSGTPYGQTLLVKLTLFVLALLSAVLVRRAFARRTRVRVPLAREALVLTAVLGVTAILSTSAPPGGHGGHALASAAATGMDAHVTVPHPLGDHGAAPPDLRGVTLCVDPDAVVLDLGHVGDVRAAHARAILQGTLRQLLVGTRSTSGPVTRSASCAGQDGRTQLTVEVRPLDPRQYVGYGGRAYACTVRLRVTPATPGGPAYAADWSAVHSEVSSGQTFETAVFQQARDMIQALTRQLQDGPGRT